MKAILFVALGGMIGAVLRYLGSLGAIRLLGDGFAYGTLAVSYTHLTLPTIYSV